MWNLYSLTPKRDHISRFLRVGHNRMPAFEPQNALFPIYNAPIVHRATDGEREIVIMSWGYVLPQPGRAPRRVTNVRDDKVRTGFSRDGFEQRRCLVPASSFCEPNGDVKPATWHWFALKGDEPRPLFAFPGMGRRHRGPVRKDGPAVCPLPKNPTATLLSSAAPRGSECRLEGLFESSYLPSWRRPAVRTHLRYFPPIDRVCDRAFRGLLPICTPC